MANPFKTKFNSTCDSCGDTVQEGDEMYAVDGLFYCHDCANENGNVCDCGNFKKDDYEECYECHQETQQMMS